MTRPDLTGCLRLVEIGQWRVAVVEEGLGIEFDLAGGRGEAAQLAACVRLSVFGVAGLQWHWHTAGRGRNFSKVTPVGASWRHNGT